MSCVLDQVPRDGCAEFLVPVLLSYLRVRRWIPIDNKRDVDETEPPRSDYVLAKYVVVYCGAQHIGHNVSFRVCSSL